MGQFVVAESIDCACWRTSLDATADPALHALGEHLVRAKERHVAFGWAVAEGRLPVLAGDPARVRAVEDAVALVLAAERAGLRLAGLLADGATSPASAALAGATDVAAAAGLGTASHAALVAALEAAVAGAAVRLAPFGITIPNAPLEDR